VIFIFYRSNANCVKLQWQRYRVDPYETDGASRFGSTASDLCFLKTEPRPTDINWLWLSHCAHDAIFYDAAVAAHNIQVSYTCGPRVYYSGMYRAWKRLLVLGSTDELNSRMRRSIFHILTTGNTSNLFSWLMTFMHFKIYFVYFLVHFVVYSVHSPITAHGPQQQRQKKFCVQDNDL